MPNQDGLEEVGGFIIVPDKVRSCSSITDGAKLFYGDLLFLGRRKSYSWATDASLTQMYGLHERKIHRYIAELKEAGFISVDMVSHETGRRREIRCLVRFMTEGGSGQNPPDRSGKKEGGVRTKSAPPILTNISKSNILDFGSDEPLIQEPPKELPKEPEKPKAVNPTAIFCEAYTARYGVSYVVTKADAGMLKRQFGQVGEETFRTAITGYFECDEKFTVDQQAHSVGWFISKFNRWMRDGKASETVGTMPKPVVEEDDEYAPPWTERLTIEEMQAASERAYKQYG